MIDSGIGMSRDRLSTLPDCVLSHILSFLPTKYAVGTSILSSRWRYLWAYVPILDFDDTLYFDKTKERGLRRSDVDEECFKKFVDRVLHLTDASCIQSFHLELMYMMNDFALVETWISSVIMRGVKKMELRYLEFPMNLPSMLFTCKTLVVLIINGDILLDVLASVWLPSLKVLHLEFVRYENEDTARNLFSGCPVLEELFMDRCIFDDLKVVDVSCVPTLKHLKLSSTHLGESFSEDSDSDADDLGLMKLVIDAPKLEHLELEDYVANIFCAEDLSSLLHPRLRAQACLYEFLIGITNVNSLELADNTLFFLSRQRPLPTFQKLTYLKLETIGYSAWDFLTEFLECSPNLQVLVLQKARHHYRDLQKCWLPPRQVPNCLSSHLKDTQLQNFTGKERHLVAIKYMLKNGKVLKKMTIDCRASKVKKDVDAFKELIGFPRGSATCKLDLRFSN